MKKVGRPVLFLATGPNNPRNGEGAFIRLKNGSILFAYTAYYGDDWNDHCSANISAYISRDEGETWEGPQVIVEKDPQAQNIMSVSFLRMGNGDIGLFYIRKVMVDGMGLDEIVLRRSADEGLSWSAPQICLPSDDYRVLNNDRVVKLRSGRLLMPVAIHSPTRPGFGTGYKKGEVSVYRSDDDGKTWTPSHRLLAPFENDADGLQEPGVFELPDGRIWMFIRTAYGHQYESFSSDGGETWCPVRPALNFPSPLSPMQVKTVGSHTVAIFNPVPRAAWKLMEDKKYFWRVWGRTPYAMSVSDDGGVTFTRTYLIEDDINDDYCYPAVIDGEDCFLVAYYHSNGTNVALNSQKIIKVMYSEITAE